MRNEWKKPVCVCAEQDSSVQMTLGKFPGLNLLRAFSIKVTFKQASDTAFQNTRSLMTIS